MDCDYRKRRYESRADPNLIGSPKDITKNQWYMASFLPDAVGHTFQVPLQSERNDPQDMNGE